MRGRVVSKLVSGSTVHALSQTGYDSLGRPECTAQRMNPAVFGSTLPAACTLGTQGTGTNDFGPDRITKTSYDEAGRVTQVKTALGTPDEASEVIATYTANGVVETVTDGENNKTTYDYDGHDRLLNTRYPVSTKGALTSARPAARLPISSSSAAMPTATSSASATGRGRRSPSATMPSAD